MTTHPETEAAGFSDADLERNELARKVIGFHRTAAESHEAGARALRSRGRPDGGGGTRHTQIADMIEGLLGRARDANRLEAALEAERVAHAETRRVLQEVGLEVAGIDVVDVDGAESALDRIATSIRAALSPQPEGSRRLDDA